MIKLVSKIACTLFLICSCFISSAQLIDNSSTFRLINHTRYFRFHYDNDFFTKSDEYYSQGIAFEYVHPSIKKLVLSKLLWKPFKSIPQYGVALNVFGYTPTSIASDSILYGDRPFDADITLKTFLVQVDDIHHQQLSTAFSIGVMGPTALGKEIQTNIHRWLKNPLPHGWQYQIQNDVILNYQLNYEKQLFSFGNNFLLNATAELRAGTLNDNLSSGLNFMAGRFNKRFSPFTDHKGKAEYYLYGQGKVNLIGYDASMQGGLFNRQSPYIIHSRDISRVTLQVDAGIIVNLKNIFFSYTQSFLSKEFSTGTSHRWGGISMGFAL